MFHVKHSPAQGDPSHPLAGRPHRPRAERAPSVRPARGVGGRTIVVVEDPDDGPCGGWVALMLEGRRMGGTACEWCCCWNTVAVDCPVEGQRG